MSEQHVVNAAQCHVVTAATDMQSTSFRHLKVKGRGPDRTHLSMLSRTASTLWNNALKVGRSLGSLLQHSVMMSWI